MIEEVGFSAPTFWFQVHKLLLEFITKEMQKYRKNYLWLARTRFS